MDALEPRPWNPERQCVGTNRAGERCARNAIPGGDVCVMHGGAAPQVREAAKLRLLGMVEPILSVFEEVVATWRGTRCATCGKPTGDPYPVLRIGQLVLDRSGFHPTLAVEHAPPAAPNPYESMTDDEIVTKLEQMLADAIRTRDGHHRRLPPMSAADAQWPPVADAVLLDEGFVIEPDEPEPEAPAPDAPNVWLSPPGGMPITENTPEIPKENGDD